MYKVIGKGDSGVLSNVKLLRFIFFYEVGDSTKESKYWQFGGPTFDEKEFFSCLQIYLYLV